MAALLVVADNNAQFDFVTVAFHAFPYGGSAGSVALCYSYNRYRYRC